MKILFTIIRKEAIHIMRDTRTMILTLLIPLLLLLLFGFAISTEVNNVKVGAVVERIDDSTREILEQLSHNDYFRFQGLVEPEGVEPLLRAGDIDAVLYFKGGKTQVVVDAANPTNAQAVSGYVQGVLSRPDLPNPFLTTTLYNPQMKSAFNFVPGILGMIFILICAIMTSVSIVREKETGTMNLLLVSPVRPLTIIAGKLIPYFVLSTVILGLMLTISFTMLGLPLSGSIGSVVLISMVYIILALSIGLLVSTLVSTQLTALIVSAVLFMIPVIMLSGMIFPIENMPVVLQWISGIIPARWYVDAMRKLMIQQLDISYVVNDLLILVSITVIVLGVALKKFNSR